MDITELLAFSEKQGASDLHLSAGLPPMIRVDGDIRRINLPALDHKEVHGLIYEIMKSSLSVTSLLRSPVSPVSALMRLTTIEVRAGSFERFRPRSSRWTNWAWARRSARFLRRPGA